MAAKTKRKSKRTSGAAKSGADTVLFIHGMWGGGHQWRGWQDIFEARGYATLAPSLRHHDVDPMGEPPAGLGRVSLLDYVADLEAEIAKLPGKPIILGHSMGGLIAQILVSRGGGYRVYDNHAHFVIAEDGWEAVAEDCAAWIETAVRAKAGG